MQMTPAEQAQYDQAHAAALGDLEEFIATARRLVAKHGAQGAAHHMLFVLLDSAEANGGGLIFAAGTAALALVELTRREVE